MSASPGAAPKKGKYGIGVLIPITFIALFIGVFVFSYWSLSKLEDRATEYVEHLRAGRTSEAYAMLCEEQRRLLTEESFLQSMHSPELQRAGEPSWVKSESSSNGRACVVGGIPIEGTTERVRIFLLEPDDGAPCVHTVIVNYGIRVVPGPWTCDRS